MNGRALVAWNLRRIRVKRGISQERLAYDAEVDRSYVGGLERREENPTVDVLDRLAKTLSVPIAECPIFPTRFPTELLTTGWDGGKNWSVASQERQIFRDETELQDTGQDGLQRFRKEKKPGTHD